jgi:hypothetical protein
MSALRYVRIIRMGSMVEPSRVKRRGARKELTALQDGDWIEGVLTKPVRVGDGFRLRVFIHNGQACRRLYITSPVVTIQADQVLTCEVRYMFLRVPAFDSKTGRPQT